MTTELSTELIQQKTALIEAAFPPSSADDVGAVRAGDLPTDICPRVWHYTCLIADGWRHRDAERLSGVPYSAVNWWIVKSKAFRKVWKVAQSAWRSALSVKAQDVITDAVAGEDVGKDRLRAVTWALEKTDDAFADRRGLPSQSAVTGGGGGGIIINLIAPACRKAVATDGQAVIDV